jgi:hypothetical protein
MSVSFSTSPTINRPRRLKITKAYLIRAGNPKEFEYYYPPPNLPETTTENAVINALQNYSYRMEMRNLLYTKFKYENQYFNVKLDKNKAWQLKIIARSLNIPNYQILKKSELVERLAPRIFLSLKGMRDNHVLLLKNLI